MRTYRLPDGTLVEYVVADSYAGPNHAFSRMNVNSTAMFVRKVGGPWHCSDERSMMKTKAWLEACDSWEDAVYALGLVDPTQENN